VVAYRQALMPLVDVAARLRGQPAFKGRRGEAGRPWQVVVHAHHGKRIGMVFGRVMDIVEHRLDVRGDARRDGVRVTAVVQGQATEILDVAAIRASVPDESIGA
jgi:chemotaxis signal transduction protein